MQVGGLRDGVGAGPVECVVAVVGRSRCAWRQRDGAATKSATAVSGAVARQLGFGRCPGRPPWRGSSGAISDSQRCPKTAAKAPLSWQPCSAAQRAHQRQWQAGCALGGVAFCAGGCCHTSASGQLRVNAFTKIRRC